MCLTLLCLLLACTPADSPAPDSPNPDTQDSTPRDSAPKDSDTQAPEIGNVLVVIADDVGLDSAACYNLSSDPVRMPNLEALCSRGVRFERAWTTPICSPTRATMLSGTDPAIHGVLRAHTDGAPALLDGTLTLPAIASQAGIATASFGKWHLGDDPGVGATVPNHFGWQHFSGLLTGGVSSYWSWRRTENGLTQISTTYTTTSLVDDAVTWVDQQDGPWLMWMGFNAPRPPYHVPPESLHTDTTLGAAGDCPPGESRACYVAALEALDSEMGRLLDHIQARGELENTLVFFIGDNGTENDVAVDPVVAAKGKGSLFEGGIRIPFVVAGPGVAQGQVADGLTDATDLLPTLMDYWALPNPDQAEGVSLLGTLADPSVASGKETVFTGYLASPVKGNNGWTLANQDYKLLHFESGTRLMFKISEDPWETNNLLPTEDAELLAIYEELDAELVRGKSAGGF